MTRKNLSTKNLRRIRNITLVSEVIVIFILCSYVPAIIKNSAIVHVGNGKYGPGAASLLLTIFPLLGLLTHGGNKWDDKEIHTDDSVEKMQIEDARKSETLKCQILLSAFLFLGACVGIFAVICMG